jgi:hypothetical protein
MDYVRGDPIRLRAFGGKQIVRRFVEKRGASMLICSHEEYDLALREGREPLCIGFRAEDIIEDKRQRRSGHQPSSRSANNKTKDSNGR